MRGNKTGREKERERARAKKHEKLRQNGWEANNDKHKKWGKKEIKKNACKVDKSQTLTLESVGSIWTISFVWVPTSMSPWRKQQQQTTKINTTMHKTFKLHQIIFTRMPTHKQTDITLYNKVRLMKLTFKKETKLGFVYAHSMANYTLNLVHHPIFHSNKM